MWKFQYPYPRRRATVGAKRVTAGGCSGRRERRASVPTRRTREVYGDQVPAVLALHNDSTFLATGVCGRTIVRFGRDLKPAMSTPDRLIHFASRECGPPENRRADLHQIRPGRYLRGGEEVDVASMNDQRLSPLGGPRNLRGGRSHARHDRRQRKARV